MIHIELALQSARDALRDCRDKLEVAVQGLDKLLDEGKDTPVPAGDVERLHTNCIAMLRTLERIVR